MVLLTAWKIVLARHSGHVDIRVGAPVANRPTLESQACVGPFVNTVVLRTDLTGNPPASELLQRVKVTVLDAQAHQELPFEQVVEVLAPDRMAARHPLFNVMHNHQQRGRMSFGGLSSVQIEAFERHGDVTRFDLSLNTEEQGDSLSAAITYSTDLYDASTIARLARHWVSVLSGLLSSPAALIDEIPMLSDAESAQVLCEFNDTARSYSPHISVHRRFELQAALTPDAEALVFETSRLSYRELNQRANRLAAALRAQGVGPDVLVGICSERSVELIVGLLAILKAGGAYVPLDPSYPRERLAFILDDARPRVVLVAHQLLDTLPAAAGATVRLLDEPILASTADADENDRRQDTPAESGVLPVHLRLYRTTQVCGQHARRTAEPAPVAAGCVSHGCERSRPPQDADRIRRLGMGSVLAVDQRRHAGDCATGRAQRPWRLREIINDQRITTLHFVPPMLNAFLEASELQRCQSLRRVFVGGQSLPIETQASFFRQCSAQLHNLYGPTEAAIDVSFWECRANADESIIPIGRAIANTQLYVLDNALSPAPIGVVGELYIAGVALARGYLGRPGLTANQFLPSPFAPGERLYRTGDLARYRADGVLEYVGRIDHQVKVRGFRIELGEIEARMREHALVHDVVVLIGRDLLGENELIAYVVRAGGNTVAADDLESKEQIHRHLAKRLPEYMLPMRYVWLQSLPLLTNGKIDRAALASHKAAVGRKDFVAPRTDTERLVAATWSEVLKVEEVGRHDNFFQLGGHSLLATKAIARARRAFNIDLPLRALFECPRPRRLCRAGRARSAEWSRERARSHRDRRSESATAVVLLPAAHVAALAAGSAECRLQPRGRSDFDRRAGPFPGGRDGAQAREASRAAANHVRSGQRRRRAADRRARRDPDRAHRRSWPPG